VKCAFSPRPAGATPCLKRHFYYFDNVFVWWKTPPKHHQNMFLGVLWHEIGSPGHQKIQKKKWKKCQNLPCWPVWQNISFWPIFEEKNKNPQISISTWREMELSVVSFSVHIQKFWYLFSNCDFLVLGISSIYLSSFEFLEFFFCEVNIFLSELFFYQN